MQQFGCKGMNVGLGGFAGGVLALIWVYVPSWLLVSGALPIWERIRSISKARNALVGINAAVVGVLFAAFYDPILLKGISTLWHLIVALTAFTLLRYAKLPSWLLVAGCAGVGSLVF